MIQPNKNLVSTSPSPLCVSGAHPGIPNFPPHRVLAGGGHLQSSGTQKIRIKPLRLLSLASQQTVPALRKVGSAPLGRGEPKIHLDNPAGNNQSLQTNSFIPCCGFSQETWAGFVQVGKDEIFPLFSPGGSVLSLWVGALLRGRCKNNPCSFPEVK